MVEHDNSLDRQEIALGKREAQPVRGKSEDLTMMRNPSSQITTTAEGIAIDNELATMQDPSWKAAHAATKEPSVSNSSVDDGTGMMKDPTATSAIESNLSPEILKGVKEVASIIKQFDPIIRAERGKASLPMGKEEESTRVAPQSQMAPLDEIQVPDLPGKGRSSDRDR